MTVLAPERVRFPEAMPGAGRFLTVAALLLAWELAARLLDGAFLLAGPVEVALYLYANAALLGRALAETLRNAAFGFVLGNLAALALALAGLLLPRAERLISALALLLFCLPLVATGPILRVVFGPGAGPQIALAALAVYYTTYLTVAVGLRAVPPSWFDLVRSYGRGGVTELVQIRALAALPYLVAGLRIAAPAAILGAMVGEFTGAERGLGVLAIRALGGLDAAAIWAVAAVSAATSILAYGAIGWLGRRLRFGPPALILARPSPEPARRSGVVRALARAGLVALAALSLWWGSMAALDLDRFFAKRPDDVWAFLVSAPEAGANRAVLLSALGETLLVAGPGYLAGLALGAGLAVALVLLPGLAALVLPLAVALRSVPIVTTAPLIVFALGRGSAGTLAIVAAMIFFPALVACLEGLRQAPGQILEIFDSYGAGRVSRLLHVRLPAMLPAFFAAARMGVPAAFLAATTAEWLATGSGVGALMALTASTSAYGMLWSATGALALLAFGLYLAVEAVERAVLRRYAGEQLVR